MKNTKSGFTLIELLVVISIIGMLSSVILVGLSSARNKGKDASAMTSMLSMRNAAALVMSSNGTYPSDLCTNTLLTLRTAVNKQVPTPNAVVCYLGNSNTRWAASVTLNSTKPFCVDSTGFAGPTTASNSGVCNLVSSGS